MAWRRRTLGTLVAGRGVRPLRAVVSLGRARGSTAAGRCGRGSRGARCAAGRPGAPTGLGSAGGTAGVAGAVGCDGLDDLGLRRTGVPRARRARGAVSASACGPTARRRVLRRGGGVDVGVVASLRRSRVEQRGHLRDVTVGRGRPLLGVASADGRRRARPAAPTCPRYQRPMPISSTTADVKNISGNRSISG